MNLFVLTAMIFAASVSFWVGYQTGRDSVAMEQFGAPPRDIFSMMPGQTIEVPQQKDEVKAEAEE